MLAVIGLSSLFWKSVWKYVGCWVPWILLRSGPCSLSLQLAVIGYMDHLVNKAVKCLPHLVSFNCLVSLKFLVFGNQHAIKRAVGKWGKRTMITPCISQVRQGGLLWLMTGLQPLFSKLTALGQDVELWKCAVGLNTEWIFVTNHINSQWWR